MQSPVLGIDLGTTNSVVAIADGRQARVLPDGEGRRLVPSVVSFHPDGSILVGHEARERRLVDAANTIYSTKRLIGRPFTSIEVQRAKERVAFALEPTAVGGVQVRVRRGTFALPEISAMVLRHLRTMAENAIGQPCTRAVITVPANFNELQRSATQAAGKVAGLEVLRILNEPTAATLAYGYSKDTPETLAVFDLGGGTFDLTVLDLDKDVFEVVSTAGDTFLGGDDIDVLVADRMALACLQQHRYDVKTDPQTYERLRAAGEWVKCQLSMVTEVEVTLEELLHDTHGRTIDFRFRMTREELEGLTRPLIARAFDVVGDALRSAGRRPKEIGSVVLVGGSTRMPIVRRMVAEYFGREPRGDIDPDLVVAQGAAIHGYTLGGEKRRNTQPLGQEVARVALKRVAPPKVDVKARVPVPPRKQPAFAPEDPRDQVLDEPTRIAAAPSRDDRPARRVSTESSARGTPAAPPKPASAKAPPEPSHPAFGLDEEDAPTQIGRLPTRPPLPDGPDLSVPFEVPSAVAVMRTHAVGVPQQPAAPLTPEARRRKDSLLDLDPVEALPLRRTRDPSPATAPIEPPRVEAARPPREPTMRIGTGRDPQPIAPPAPPPIAAPASRPAAPGTLALSSSDLRPATGAARPAPPPPPAAPAPDREQIQAALFGGRAKSFGEGAFGEVPNAPSLPVPEPGLRSDIFAFDPPSASTPIALDAPLGWDAPLGLPEPAKPAAPAAPATRAPEPAPLKLGAPPQVSPQAMAPRQPVVAMADRAAPLLMDVTPLALGLETAGGYCQHLVARNAPIPTEKTRVFSTAKDDQSEVEVRICQGESNVFNDNQALGAIQLTQLRKARRGQVRIEVTFMIDASGILDVKATDLDTKQQQALRIALRGGIADGEVDAMRKRQAELFAAQR